MNHSESVLHVLYIDRVCLKHELSTVSAFLYSLLCTKIAKAIEGVAFIIG
jgi:hypothetical protein